MSGLAKGFDTPLLMLTELSGEVLGPMDYREQMRYYTTPTEAGKLTEEWFQQNLEWWHRLLTKFKAKPYRGGKTCN